MLFADHGLEATGLRAIAAAAGLSLGALYHYFPTKDAIVEALIDDTVRAPQDSIRRISAIGSLQEVLHQTGIRFLESVTAPEGKRRFEVIFLAAHRRREWAIRYLDGLLGPAEDALADAIHQRLPASLEGRVDPRVLAKQLNGALISFVVHEEILRPEGGSTDQRRAYVDQLVEIVTAGLDTLASRYADPSVTSSHMVEGDRVQE